MDSSAAGRIALGRAGLEGAGRGVFVVQRVGGSGRCGRRRFGGGHAVIVFGEKLEIEERREGLEYAEERLDWGREMGAGQTGAPGTTAAAQAAMPS